MTTGRPEPALPASAPSLRPAEDRDAARVAEIWERGWRDGHLGNVPDELVRHRTADSFRRRADAMIPRTRVAEVDGVLAGFAVVDGDEVEQVYVDAPFRGSGVAARLLDDAVRAIRAAGHARPWLAVVPGNTRARRFYERQGWVDAGAVDYDAEVAGGSVSVPCRRYELPAGSPR